MKNYIMQTKTTNSEMVSLWKKNKIEECRMDFSCGGDSMNDYSFVFFNKKGDELTCEDLSSFFEDEVFRRVEFYECSDGHYIGEFGQVIITLTDDEDDFNYNKCSKSEWSESYSDVIPIKLNKDELKFIKEKVDNMNGGEGEKNINYKIDCVITDDEEDMVENLLEKIDKICNEHEFNVEDGEAEDFYRWNTDENDEIEIDDSKLLVSVTRNYMEVRENDI